MVRAAGAAHRVQPPGTLRQALSRRQFLGVGKDGRGLGLIPTEEACLRD